jgi:hypothetical protein
MNEIRNVRKTPTQPIAIINPLSLKHGLIDPMQNSPPSVWKARLMKRINNTNIPSPTKL